MSIDKFVYDENGEAVGFYGHSEFDEDSPQDVADLWEELMWCGIKKVDSLFSRIS